MVATPRASTSNFPTSENSIFNKDKEFKVLEFDYYFPLVNKEIYNKSENKF